MKYEVVNVRRPCRMSWRWAPAAHAAAAAASAFWTFMRARPSKVAGRRWVHTSGIDLRPWRSTIISPLRPFSSVTARRPRDAWNLMRSFSGSMREVHDRAGGVARHGRDQRVVGVEHRGPVARHRLDDHLLHLGQLLEGVDAAQAEVVAGHVEDHRDVVAVVAEALAQDSAARHLEDREVDERVLEHGGGGARPGGIGLPDQAAVDVDAVGGGQADLAAHALHDVGDHPGGGRLAVGAGDGHDRDAGVGAGREEHVDHRLGDVLRLALGRVGVHAEAGRGVDLHDPAARLAHRAR